MQLRSRALWLLRHIIVRWLPPPGKPAHTLKVLLWILYGYSEHPVGRQGERSWIVALL